MENGFPQKIKLLKLIDFLKRETDEENPISRQDLCEKLNSMGIPSNPRTLSLDIALLNESGYEIMSEKRGHEVFFYVSDRTFSVPELKILIDAVEAASFISKKKTAGLTDKIASLGGIHRAELLKRDLVFFNLRKHANETVLYSVDSIADAINRGKAVSFNYFHLDRGADRVYRRDENGEKKKYLVEPVALVFFEDNYYLNAYSPKYPGTTANYRIDRIDNVKIDENTDISEEARSFLKGIGDYTGKTFKMYHGETVSVTLEFDEGLVEPVFDKFGEDVGIAGSGDGTLRVTTDVSVSPVFFGWVFQFDGKMRIVSPERVVEEYERMKRE